MPIELRHRTFFCYLDVPIDVRSKLGRRVFRQTLKTDSRSVAMRRAPGFIARWKQEIATARDEPNTNDAKFWRDALRRAKDDQHRASILEQIDMATWDVGAANVDQVGQSPSGDPVARRFREEATGAHVPTTEHLEEWIGSLQVKAKTAGMRRASVNRLAEKFAMLRDVMRPEVRRWVTELVAGGLNPSTVQRMLSDCRTFWAYLATINAVPEDSAPFDKLGLKVKTASWLPYTPEEAVRLLRGAETDEPLANLIRLSMYSGARREELCSLRVEHIRGDRFEIVDAKTEAGIRTVPIHAKLKRTIARLIGESTDGFLFTGLEPNKNGDRGDVLGKRFTRLKTSMGFDARHVFHSFRGTVITMLERAGIPEGTVQDIVGHSRSTLTGSTYSGKSTLEMRRAALARLRYPVDVSR